MPATLDLTGDLAIYRGDHYVLLLVASFTELPGVTLADFTFTAQARKSPRRSSELVAEFAVDVDVDTLALTLTDEETLDMPSVYFWDLQAVAVADGFIETWLSGTGNAEGDVTAPDPPP